MSIVLVTILGIIYFLKVSTPTLKLRVSNKDIHANSEIVVEAVLSSLPKNIYPAGSAKISFDKNKLEFKEVTLGTIEVYDNYDSSKEENQKTFKIPNWTFDVNKANNDGIIKTMYLDSSGGKNSYSEEGFKKKEKDILFRIKFKLKDSVNKGDKLDLKIDEAVIATITGKEDKSTLATKKGYGDLNIKNLVIKVK